ncbi:hypothetical protein JTE90_025255 [Oedothorax gibbosus]|uniref:Uncharacterized protein n=1 Tax=Oedothorax gibbosus TaxID=931172 RepID=A0AAV6U8I2_9ARAC|nr:hypothetical protein JTE90_025255 [Oedothorax gibbosus]
MRRHMKLEISVNSHKDKYLHWYPLNQRTCCYPLDKHPLNTRSRSLKQISLDFSKKVKNPVIILGKKLCASCYSSFRPLINETESQITTPERESDSDEEYFESPELMEQLNESCKDLKVSPIKVSKFSYKRKHDYVQSKVKKICSPVVSKASAATGIDISNPSTSKDMSCQDCMSTMQKLLQKFTNASFNEKIMILTLVLDSWTILQTRNYFNTTEYLVKKKPEN